MSGRLTNKAIFLSASVPSRDGWPEASSRQAGALIRSAIMACTRRIIFEGGILVFGGHPSVSPFILSVANDYLSERDGGSLDLAPRIRIFQSLAFPRSVRPEATKRLVARGAELVETDAASGEEFDATSRQEQCLESLRIMRRRMLQETDPIAMVVIGGMEGILRECVAFRSQFRSRQIWTFESAGGMGAELRAPKNEAARRVFESVRIEPKAINALPVEELLDTPHSSDDSQSQPPYTFLAERWAALVARGTKPE